MPTSERDALVETVPAATISGLAALYDRFARALDPFSEERDQAEQVFIQEVENLYDQLPAPKPEFRVFRNGVIVRCLRHLRATDKPAAV
jgi:hypothetical protein